MARRTGEVLARSACGFSAMRTWPRVNSTNASWIRPRCRWAWGWRGSRQGSVVLSVKAQVEGLAGGGPEKRRNDRGDPL